VNPSPLSRAVTQDDLRRCAHKHAPFRGAGDKSLNLIQDSQITRGLPQFEEFAANPFPSSAHRARPQMASPIDQHRSRLGFRPKPRAEACQMMMQLEAAPQRAVNKQ
jgi:hypothetical protein